MFSFFSSELKRRLKAEKKAQEKAAKAASEQENAVQKPAASKKVLSLYNRQWIAIV